MLFTSSHKINFTQNVDNFCKKWVPVFFSMKSIPNNLGIVMCRKTIIKQFLLHQDFLSLIAKGIWSIIVQLDIKLKYHLRYD